MKKYFLFFISLYSTLFFSQIAKDSVNSTTLDDLKIFPCLVNNKNMQFELDSLSSGVKISIDEAIYLSKNGMTNEDMRIYEPFDVQKTPFVDGLILNIKEIQIGNLTLTNVDATVEKNQEISLIFGQKIIEKLGKIKIENNKFYFSKITTPEPYAPIKIDKTNEEFNAFRRQDLIDYSNNELRTKLVRDLRRSIREDEKEKTLRIVLNFKVDIRSVTINEQYNQDVEINQKMVTEKMMFETFRIINSNEVTKSILSYYEKINFVIGFTYIDKNVRLTNILTREKLKELPKNFTKEEFINAVDFSK